MTSTQGSADDRSSRRKDAGVYLVQLEAYDRIGRRQQVSVDFFVGGDTPVTFAAAAGADRDRHDSTRKTTRRARPRRC